ncbi:MAG: 16S rRNA (uracil(1498)-N(3))-methyltransferase [Pseudomonadota bacterium]
MVRPAPRLFTSERLGKGSLALGQEHARYLGQVLRLGPGSDIRVFNGRDGEWLYRIARIDRRGGDALPVEQTRLQAEATGLPVLLFAPLKRGPTEIVIQKATELGAAVLQPVVTARTSRDNLRLDRLGTIAVEAAEQCERLTIPEIREPAPLGDALEAHKSFVFCDEAGNQPSAPWGGEEGRAGLADHVFGPVESPPSAVLIGPEGGFTPDERSALREDRRALPISLGPRILRAETAAIVALTLWQTRFGDFS